MNPELSITLVTYNEQANVQILIPQIVEILSMNGISFEIIVVDDSSTDGTIETMERFAQLYGPERIRLIVRREKGVATAIKRSYDEARGEFIAALDADLAHDPKHLPEMLLKVKNREADIVVGSRYIRGAELVGKPFLNRFASKFSQILIWAMLGLTTRDTSNHFRILRRQLYMQFAGQLHPKGNVMIVEMLYRAKKLGAKIVEIPIFYQERKFGESKLRLWRETKNFFQGIWRIRFSN